MTTLISDKIDFKIRNTLTFLKNHFKYAKKLQNNFRNLHMVSSSVYQILTFTTFSIFLHISLSHFLSPFFSLSLGHLHTHANIHTESHNAHMHVHTGAPMVFFLHHLRMLMCNPHLCLNTSSHVPSKPGHSLV